MGHGENSVFEIYHELRRSMALPHPDGPQTALVPLSGDVRSRERMQTIFLAAFDDTQAAFGEVFPVLFPGGTGSISLTNPDDPLTTGIEVSVRPVGKKIERLSLLSGGERSLAAVALLVAIFKARPSPFYILDEVEAAGAPRALVITATGKIWSNGLDLEWMGANTDGINGLVAQVQHLYARVLGLGVFTLGYVSWKFYMGYDAKMRAEEDRVLKRERPA